MTGTDLLVYISIYYKTNCSLLKGFLGFLNFGHFLLKYVKLENSFEPSVVPYVIDLYSKVVVKILDIGDQPHF
jgi:hypothetical protein